MKKTICLKIPIGYTNDITTNSKYVIAIDRTSKTILYQKNAFDKTPMASTTKIMTCIIILENADLSKDITISKNASSVSGSTLGLEENMKISTMDLLYGLMLRSGNDCAVALAEDLAGSIENFSILMNQKAFDLGLSDTHFITPHGLDNENHYTTAYDLALLTDYALNNETFKTIVSTKTYTFNFNGYLRTINNTNELLGTLDGVYGVKTGFTFGAGRCLVSACCRNDLDIIVVVLGADTKKIRTQDSSNLINYIFENFEYVNVYDSINESFLDLCLYAQKSLILEKTSTAPIFKLEVLDNYIFPLNSKSTNLSAKLFLIKNYSYKLNQNEQVGSLYLYNNETLLCEIKVYLDNTLPKNTFIYYLNYFFTLIKA